MAVLFPDFDRYKPDKTLRTRGGGRHGCEVFNAKGNIKRDSGLLIGVLHGWLGAGTMRFVANAAREHGHTVFVVNQAKFQHNDRSKAVHEATKVAVKETGIADVFYVAHSLSARDIVTAAKFQQANPAPEYTVRRLATVDGVGTNGMDIDLIHLGLEVRGFADLLLESPRTYAETMGRSALNFVRSPLAHIIEGISTIRYDATEDVLAIRKAGVVVTHDFHEDDLVVRPPTDDRGVIHEGSHMSFVCNRETIDSLVIAA
jgi:hypothetical protein